MADAACILRHAAGFTNTDEVALLCADMNGDARVDVVDASALLRWLVGLLDPPGINEAHYYILYNGNGHTGGSPPPGQLVKVGQEVTLRMNTGEMTKAGSAPFLGWNTNAQGSGTNYTPGFPIIPTSSLKLYALWGTPTYPARTVKVKLWVDKTYRDCYSNWASEAATIANLARYPFYQTFNLNMIVSAPDAMTTDKWLCQNGPQAPCDISLPTCGTDCNTHHSSTERLLQYVLDNGDSNYGMNTLFYYGIASCHLGIHTKQSGGSADKPGNHEFGPSTVQCYTIAFEYNAVRRVQHEWSHNYGADHSGIGGTYCTSDCINNGGWDDKNYPVPDVWCSRCKAAMAPYLDYYNK